MKPSQVAQELRHIATKIQNSKNPDRKLVAQDLKQVLAALAPFGTAWLLMSDAPFGICAGFKPTDEQLKEFPAEAHELKLISDDGSEDGMPYHDYDVDPSGRSIFIAAPGSNPGFFEDSDNKPLMGPDMNVWRSTAEFDAYLEDWLHG